VWIHALSIGELLSAGSLIQSLRRELGDRPLYLSVSPRIRLCHGGQDRLSSEFAKRNVLVFPTMWPLRVDRCIDARRSGADRPRWKPISGLGFLGRRSPETEFPCILVNGRVSPDSFRL
jgi:3-deoxy-D-manno-octulosonic-acid transferase